MSMGDKVVQRSNLYVVGVLLKKITEKRGKKAF